MRAVRWFGIFALAAAFAFAGCESKEEGGDEKKEEGAENEGEGEAGEGGEGEAAEGGEEGGDEAESRSREDILADAKAGKFKEGDSCVGLSAAEGMFSCDDRQVLFCSSASEYKWTPFNDPCDEGKVCTLSEDAKQSTCENAEAEGDGEAVDGEAADGEGEAAEAEGEAAEAEGEAAEAEGEATE